MPKCKGCGAEIIWATTESNHPIPLDAKFEMRLVLTEEPPPLSARGGAEVPKPVLRAKLARTYVSHFATCPNAKQFRRAQ